MSGERINLALIRTRMEGSAPELPQSAAISVPDVLALLDAVEAARTGVVDAAVVVEVLRAEDERKPYRELSPEMRATLRPTCDSLRNAARQLARFDFGDDE